MKNLCPCVPKRFPNYTHVHTHNDESAGHQVAQQVARYSSWWPGQNAQNDREWSKLSRSLCLKWLKNMSLAKFHLSVRSPARAACWWLWCCWCKWGFALFLLIFYPFFLPIFALFCSPIFWSPGGLWGSWLVVAVVQMVQMADTSSLSSPLKGSRRSWRASSSSSYSNNFHCFPLIHHSHQNAQDKHFLTLLDTSWPDLPKTTPPPPDKHISLHYVTGARLARKQNNSTPAL